MGRIRSGHSGRLIIKKSSDAPHWMDFYIRVTCKQTSRNGLINRRKVSIMNAQKVIFYGGSFFTCMGTSFPLHSLSPRQRTPKHRELYLSRFHPHGSAPVVTPPSPATRNADQTPIQPTESCHQGGPLEHTYKALVCWTRRMLSPAMSRGRIVMKNLHLRM